jgi:hypothetical protein
MSDSHYEGRSVWCRTPPRAHGKIFKLISDTLPKGRDRVGAGRDPMGGWSPGGSWDRSTGNSASNQMLPLINVHNINTQCGLHGEYNVLLLERPLSYCCIVK